MTIDASILKDYVASFCVVESYHHNGRSYDWVEKRVAGEGFAQNVLYVCDGSIECVGEDEQGSSFSSMKPSVLCVRKGEDARILHCSRCKIGKSFFACESDFSIVDIVSMLQAYIRRINGWKFDMANAMLCGAMYQEVLTLSESIFRNTIIVTDAAHRLVASANSHADTEGLAQKVIENGGFDEGQVTRLTKSGFFRNTLASRMCWWVDDAADSSSAGFINHTFRVEGEFYLHLAMECNIDVPTRGLQMLFDCLVDSIGHCVMKEYYHQGVEGSKASRFISAVEQGDVHEPSSIESTCGLLGIPFEGRFRLFVLEPRNDYSLGYMARVLEKDLELSWLSVHDDEISFVSANPKHWTKQGVAEDAVLKRFAQNYNIRLGASGTYLSFTETRYAYRQAKAVLALPASALAETPFDACPHALLFEDYASFCVLNEADAFAKDEMLRYLIGHNPVKMLVDIDDAGSSCNAKILYYYLMSECDAAEAGKRLYMHRNSVYYRLKKISNLLDIDLSDQATVAYLRFLYILMKLQGMRRF